MVNTVDPLPQGVALPAGWMYRSFGVGKLSTWYASPMFQLLIVSFVCFLCPGMFNALNGLGGGGISDAKASNTANTALNATFSVVGFFGGAFTNRVGVRFTLFFGSIGYCIYTAALFNWKLHQNAGFVIFGGVLLGTCAGLLWTAQGTIMMSYPEERFKGRYISIFWAIFNLGAVIGSLVGIFTSRHGVFSTNKSILLGPFSSECSEQIE